MQEGGKTESNHKKYGRKNKHTIAMPTEGGPTQNTPKKNPNK